MISVLGYQNIQSFHLGNRSQLFRATEVATEKPVILKTQAIEHSNGATLRQTQQEFVLGQLVNNPHVIDYQTFIPTSEQIVLVIEDFGGAVLSACIPKAGFDLNSFFNIGEQLLIGLQAIHAQKIIHNALNPQNIIFNQETTVVKIIDFGEATQLILPAYYSESEAKSSYLAPEQTGQIKHPVDHRADLFSLGVIFYELLTGRCPAQTDLIAQNMKSPHQVRSSIPEMLSHLVMQLLQLDVEQRYQTCTAVLVDLLRCKNDWQENGRITPFQLNAQSQNPTNSIEHPDKQELLHLLATSQALSSEVDLHRLLTKLMQTIFEHTDAQLSHLILQSNKDLRIAASVTMTEDNLTISQPMSIPKKTELAESLVLDALQTGNINRFAKNGDPENGRWQNDPYLQKNQETAILCVPIQYKEKIAGVLYLENKQTGAVFGNKDIEILQFLATQTAISLENAFLYEDLTQTVIKHKRTEEELKSIDERLKIAMEAGTLGIWNWDIRTNLITWSDYVEKLFGMEKGEFDGSYETYASLIHPDDLPTLEETIAKALTDPNFDYQVTHRLVWPNGDIHWLEGTGKVYRDEQNDPIHMTGYVMDITERKKQEDSKQEREVWLERVLELGKTITAVTDWDQCLKTLHYCVQKGLQFDRVGIFLYDQMTQNIHGAYGTSTTGEREDTSWFTQNIGDDPGYTQFLNNPKGFQYIKNLSKEVEWETNHDMHGVTEHATAAVWADSKPFAIMSVDNGITNKLMTEPQLEAFRLFAGYAGFALANAQLVDQLFQQKEQLELALSATQMGTWDWDLTTDIVSWTEQVAILHGFQAEKSSSLEKRDIWSTMHPDDKSQLLSTINKAAKEDENAFRLEYRVPQTSGNMRWLEVMGKQITNETGDPLHVLGTIIDITARKQAEIDREQLIEELESRNAELERFTYTVSHDLKSPLITIRGFLGLLERDIERNDQTKVARDMERIHAAAGRMLTLLDDLLELSRIGRLTNPATAVSVNDLAAEAIELVTGRIKEHNVKLVVQPDCPAVFVDKPRLVEVFQNLIDNAVKFMGDQPAPTIQIGAYDNETEIVCFVKDNGMGIETRYLERIFNLFERLDPSIDGTGIGLALIKRIIEFHNGRIWAESEGQGQGTTFLFTLPPVTSTNSLYDQ